MKQTIKKSEKQRNKHENTVKQSINVKEYNKNNETSSKRHQQKQ